VRGKPTDIGDSSDLRDEKEQGTNTKVEVESEAEYSDGDEDEDRFPWPSEWEEDEPSTSQGSKHQPKVHRKWGRQGLRTTTGTNKPADKTPSETGSRKSKESHRSHPDPLKELKELQDPEPDSKQFLPTEVLGWLLLKGSGLSYGERATVVASTQGKLDFAGIWRALREQYPPRRTERRDDRKGGKGKGKGKKGRKGGLHSIEEDSDRHESEVEWQESLNWTE
jgi:hypothetical protein